MMSLFIWFSWSLFIYFCIFFYLNQKDGIPTTITTTAVSHFSGVLVVNRQIINIRHPFSFLPWVECGTDDYNSSSSYSAPDSTRTRKKLFLIIYSSARRFSLDESLHTKRDTIFQNKVKKRRNRWWNNRESRVPSLASASYIFLFSINICTFSLSSYFIKRNDVILGPVQITVEPLCAVL